MQEKVSEVSEFGISKSSRDGSVLDQSQVLSDFTFQTRCVRGTLGSVL